MAENGLRSAIRATMRSRRRAEYEQMLARRHAQDLTKDEVRELIAGIPPDAPVTRLEPGYATGALTWGAADSLRGVQVEAD